MDRLHLLLTQPWGALPALIVAVLFAACAGALAWWSGIRSIWLAAVAGVPLVIGGFALVGQLAAMLEVQAGPGRIGVGLVLLLLFWGAGWRWWRGRRGETEHGQALPPWTVAAGAVVGGLAAAAAWLAGIGNPALPPQNIDDIWHGYLTARLADTPQIGAGTVAPIFIDQSEPVFYYPYGLHLAAAVIRSFTGLSVPLIVNSLWVLAVAIVLPLGVALLTWRLLPALRWAPLAAGIASASVNAFPYAVNGIWPYTVTLAMTPSFVVLVLSRLAGASSVPLIAIPLAALALIVSHPAAATAAALLGGVVVLESLVLRGRAGLLGAVASLLGPALLTFVVALPWLLEILGTGIGPRQHSAFAAGVWDAARMWLLWQTPWTPGQLVLGIAVLIGVGAVVWLRRGWSIALVWLGFGAAYAGAAVASPLAFRLTTPWYGEWYRILAVAGLVAPVLVGAAVGLGVRRLSEVISVVRADRRRYVVVAVAAIAGLVGAANMGIYLLRGMAAVASAFQGKRLVTDADVRLFSELAQRSDPDSLVLASWDDGSSWAYPIAGIPVTDPYEISDTVDPRWRQILVQASNLGADPAACQQLLDHDVQYALAKKQKLAGGFFDLDAAARANPTIFQIDLETESGTIFRIDQNRLKQCAQQ